MSQLPSQLPEWKALADHVEEVSSTHLRELLRDNSRCDAMFAKYDDIVMDYSRQRVSIKTMNLLFDLAEARDLKGQIRAMFNGERINTSEDRAVLHIALRAAEKDQIILDGQNQVELVHNVLHRIKTFSENVRNGNWKGYTGKPIQNVVSIGIGGSYLGGEFVAEALKTDPLGSKACQGRTLRFLANVDPVAVKRALWDLDPATTLIVVISKTFTTAETMLNARTLRKWITDSLGDKAVPKHMVAVSANVEGVQSFGIDPQNIFEFWDWVGGRYSVCSAVGIVPLALQYGFELVEQFLSGARDMDQHFLNASPRENLPMILGLLGIWNSTFLGHSVRALLPYSEALVRFAAHLQQVDMESNGKRVTKEGHTLDFEAGEINFGEPGTNGQHSFYQLIHQGRVVPCDFIGFIESQNPIELSGEKVSNHDELMSNFFAQPDALAMGKTVEELKSEKVPEELINHKLFPGNRQSTSLLFPRLDAFNIGRLLALYEHRTAVQGAIWGVNSFDQWGVELGKVLGTKVRQQLHESRKNNVKVSDFNSSTTRLMEHYLKSSQ